MNEEQKNRLLSVVGTVLQKEAGITPAPMQQPAPDEAQALKEGIRDGLRATMGKTAGKAPKAPEKALAAACGVLRKTAAAPKASNAARLKDMFKQLRNAG